MANTFDPELVQATVTERTINLLSTQLAFLSSFQRDFSEELVDPERPFYIAVGKGGSDAQIATPAAPIEDYEQGDTEKGAVLVEAREHNKSFSLSSKELNQGHRLESLVDTNLEILAQAIHKTAMAPVTAANFNAVAPVVAPTFEDLDISDVKQLAGSLNKSGPKSLLLRSDYYSEHVPSTRDNWDLSGPAYGFSSFGQTATFEGADANVVGFASQRNALAMAARIPDVSAPVADGMLMREIVPIEKLGISVVFSLWAALKGRVTWGSFGVYFGCSLLDAESGRLVTTGA